MSLTVTSSFICTVAETLGQNTDSAAAAARLVTHNQFNRSETRNASSVVTAQETAAFIATLSAGALTIDLTSLTSTNGRTLDATGYKLIELLIINDGSNSVAWASGASNGYTIPAITVHPGGRYHQFFGGNLDAVAAGDKEIDLTGTGADTFEVLMVFGES